MQLPKRKPGKYAHDKQDPLMTRAKFDELSRKLERLRKKRPKAAAEVARLAELGDFSENVEYQLAKRRLRGINNWILKLEHQLNRAEIIKPKALDSVQIGHRVTVEVDGEKKTYTILGTAETDPAKGIISHSSPLGNALLEKKNGESFFLAIGGKERTYTIVAIMAPDSL